MTALEHAKRFIRKNAAKTALVIVPLALASQAQASPITFNVGGATATPGGSIGSVTPSGGPGTFSALPNGGIRYTGAFDYDLSFTPRSGGLPNSGFITLTLAGTGSGLLDLANIPAHFDYTWDLGVDNSFSNFVSTITFIINDGPVGSATDSHVGPAAASYAEVGNPILTGWDLLDPADLETWKVVLRADFDVPTTGAIGLTIPPLSIDIMPGAAVDDVVPEPATFALVAIGGALLLVRRRSPRR